MNQMTDSTILNRLLFATLNMFPSVRPYGQRPDPSVQMKLSVSYESLKHMHVVCKQLNTLVVQSTH